MSLSVVPRAFMSWGIMPSKKSRVASSKTVPRGAAALSWSGALITIF